MFCFVVKNEMIIKIKNKKNADFIKKRIILDQYAVIINEYEGNL
nr:hypothetical protein B11C_110135 [Bartonella sp. 1-1C]